MNYKYLLFVELKNKKIESYYADDINKLYEYAKFEIYELKKIRRSD